MAVNLRDFNKPWFGALCAKMLRAINAHDSQTACRDTWIENGWGPADILVYPTQRLLPGAVSAVQPDLFFVGISGTDSLTQVRHYVTPVLEQAAKRFYAFATLGISLLGDKDLDDRNSAFWDWGLTVARLIREAGTPRPVLLTGHSYGGAVAMAAAIALANVGYPAPIYLVTFGAPKLGTQHALHTLTIVNYVQWINNLDPIPALPPTEGEIGFPLKLAWKGIVYVIQPRYKFAGHGLRVEPNGSYAPGVPDALTPSILTILATDKLISDLVLDPFNHLLNEYDDRLSLWIPPVPASITQGTSARDFIAQGPPRTFPRSPPSQYAAAVQSVLQRRVATSNTPVAAVSSDFGYGGLPLFWGGDSMPYVPTQYSSKKMRAPKDWGVSWEGGFIATGTRTQCHSLAKALNHFLRRLQVMSKFDQTFFMHAISVYAGEASAGGLGFKPDQLPID